MKTIQVWGRYWFPRNNQNQSAIQQSALIVQLFGMLNFIHLIVIYIKTMHRKISYCNSVFISDQYLQQSHNGKANKNIFYKLFIQVSRATKSFSQTGGRNYCLHRIFCIIENNSLFYFFVFRLYNLNSFRQKVPLSAILTMRV